MVPKRSVLNWTFPRIKKLVASKCHHNVSTFSKRSRSRSQNQVDLAVLHTIRSKAFADTGPILRNQNCCFLYNSVISHTPTICGLVKATYDHATSLFIIISVSRLQNATGVWLKCWRVKHCYLHLTGWAAPKQTRYNLHNPSWPHYI